MKPLLCLMLSVLVASGAAVGIYTPTPVLRAGLVGSWPMNEGSGTNLHDASGNGNTISLVMPPVYSLSSSNTLITGTSSPVWTNDGGGMALSCAGNQYGMLAKSGVFKALSNYFTTCLWFRTTNSALQRWLTSYHLNAASGMYVGQGYGGRHWLELGLTAGGAAPDSYTNVTSTNWGPWIYYCSTWSNGLSTVYTNGVLAYSAAHDGTTMTNKVAHRFFAETTNTWSSGFAIGKYTNCLAVNVNSITNGWPFTNSASRYRRTRATAPAWSGYLRGVTLYDRVLSAGEVSRLYAAGGNWAE